jgi:hypothetical protein
MLSNVGVAVTSAGERYASEAPMFAVPVVAPAMPAPDPVPAVWIVPDG